MGKKWKKNIWKKKWRTSKVKNVWKKKGCMSNVPALLPFVFEGPSSLDVQFKSVLKQVVRSQEECAELKSRILRDLQPCLTKRFKSCYPYIFGSMATGLALEGSDVDVNLDTEIIDYSVTLRDPKEALQQLVKRCAKTLRRDKIRFSWIQPISTAKVPIVKVVHNPTGLSCDISFNNYLGVYNSQLVRFYLQLHPRFSEVMVIIKSWAKRHEVCDFRSIPSYGWTLLFISFLQSLKLPDGNGLVPSVSDLQKDVSPAPWSIVNGWRVDFHPKQDSVSLPDDPRFSHYGLLKGFFHYYDHFPFEEQFVCPFLGRPIPWDFLRHESDSLPLLWFRLNESLKRGRRHLSIQDPLQHNVFLGERCSYKNIVKVAALLNAAATLCRREDEHTDPNASMFLLQLFSLQDFQLQFNIELQSIPDLSRKQLSEEALQMLEDIFIKIMKFQVEKTEEAGERALGEPDTKVRKTVETQDVHQRNDGDAFKAHYSCVCRNPVWHLHLVEDNEQAREKLGVSSNQTAFEFQKKLSDVLLTYHSLPKPIEFFCVVRLSESLQSLTIILQQTAQTNFDPVKTLCEFVSYFLGMTMNKFLREKLSPICKCEKL